MQIENLAEELQGKEDDRFFESKKLWSKEEDKQLLEFIKNSKIRDQHFF
jgi:hypothetical protein